MKVCSAGFCFKISMPGNRGRIWVKIDIFGVLMAMAIEIILMVMVVMKVWAKAGVDGGLARGSTGKNPAGPLEKSWWAPTNGAVSPISG